MIIIKCQNFGFQNLFVARSHKIKNHQSKHKLVLKHEIWCLFTIANSEYYCMELFIVQHYLCQCLNVHEPKSFCCQNITACYTCNWLKTNLITFPYCSRFYLPIIYTISDNLVISRQYCGYLMFLCCPVSIDVWLLQKTNNLTYFSW